MRVAFHTLGCRLNQSESAVLAKVFETAGYEICTSKEPYDICVINTCTVTRMSDAKCRSAVSSMARKNPNAIQVVIGCYVDSDPDALQKMNEIDLILSNEEKLNILKYLPKEKQETPILIKKEKGRGAFTMPTTGQFALRTRANLKVQDGCSFSCNYCIIPKVRGASRSRVFENLTEDSHALYDQGFKEIVLTGVNLGLYRQQGRSLVDVIDVLNEIGFVRVRISSIEPTTIDDGILERMAEPSHNLVPFLHLPLQSGCDRVLEQMKRKYCASEYIEFIRHAAKRVPELCLGTDVILGTPYEDDASFEKTCKLLREEPIDHIHAFTYSERDGTPAADLKQHPVHIRKNRTLIVREIGQTKKQAFCSRHVGKTVDVLMEEQVNGLWQGHSANYLLVKTKASENLKGEMVQVQIKSHHDEYVKGDLIC